LPVSISRLSHLTKLLSIILRLYWINTLRFQRAQNTNIWYDTRWYLLYMRFWYNNCFQKKMIVHNAKNGHKCIFLAFCAVLFCVVVLFVCFFLFSFCVLCTQYCWCVSIVHSWLPLQFIHNVTNPPILYLPWRWIDYISCNLVNITFWPHRISINSTNVSCQLDLNSYICIRFYVQFLVIYIRK
jgi:hypothetical protein